MATRLCWQVEGEDIVFSVERGAVRLSPDQWAATEVSCSGDGRVAHVGVLRRLADDGLAVLDDETVRVPGRNVVALAAPALRGLGLPEFADVSVHVSKKGLLTDPAFEVVLRYLDARGRPRLGATRRGPLLQTGSREYTLPDALYELATAVDRLNGATGEARYEPLAVIQEHLPEGAVVDGYLRETRVLRADSFTLRPYRLPDGTVQFDPIPIRSQRRRGGLDLPEELIEGEGDQLLPAERQADWARFFRRLQKPGRTMAAGAGWYVASSPALGRALEIVKERQSAPPSEREAFARNPRAVLRERLAPVSGSDDHEQEQMLAEVEALFTEQGQYGARVREIGLWKPKVMPVLPGSQQSWLPPETMGLRVGNEVIAIPTSRTEELLEALTNAEAHGVPAVEFDGASIPVSKESIESVTALVAAAKAQSPAGEEPSAPAGSADGKIVALIADNIDEATYTRTPREVPRLRDELPASLKSTLFEFQQHGFRWMQQLWLSGAPGGILADDMGLGKTVQTLAFLAWVKEVHDDHKPMLVVGPTGLLRNWQAEHRQHLHEPGLGELIEAHGTGLAQLRLSEAGRRSELHTGFASLDLAELRRADWVLTTYENLRDYQHSFAQVPWRVVVFDEAQRIKNPEVMTTDAAKALNAELTLAVTGTPVENHLIDLWCIADTAQPGTLGSLKEFAQKYQLQGQSSPEALEELRLRVQERNPPALMLRRLKKDHLQGLPAINAHVERVTMPAVQAEQYDRAVAAARKNGPRNLSGILEALQQMRSVSLHPSLEHAGSDEAFIESSARLKHTIAVLDRLATTGEKALVFVEAIAMQDVLVELLQRRYRLPAPPIVINGELAGHKRKSRVDTFQQRHGFDVMLLSPRAGGVGLTITEANHVIHLSRWWNPAVEDQATDRVYRIGQRRDVHVHLPLAIHPQLGDGSFDALLHALLERKRALSRGVLAPAVSTEGELKDLFAASVGGSI